MRCSKSARGASAALLLTAAILGGAVPSDAQTRGRGRSAASQQEAQQNDENMRMPNVSIEGERQTPDIFFVFPTGKGGDLSAPRMRDYANDILEPVVKPWFERDQAVNPSAHVASNEKRFDWDEALRSEPDRPAPAAAAANVPPPGMTAPSMPAPQVAPPQIPSQATTQGQLGIPSQALSLPPQASSLPPPAPASSYPATAPAPSYPAQAPSYPSQATSSAGEPLTYPSVPTANKPHYPAGYQPPSYPATSSSSAPSYQAPSYPKVAPTPQPVPQQPELSPESQSQRQLGIPSWATKPPPGPYQR